MGSLPPLDDVALAEKRCRDRSAAPTRPEESQTSGIIFRFVFSLVGFPLIVTNDRPRSSCRALLDEKRVPGGNNDNALIEKEGAKDNKNKWSPPVGKA